MAVKQGSIHFEGIDDLRRKLREIPAAIRGELLSAALLEGGEIMRAEMERLLTKRSGHLVESLVVELESADENGAVVNVGTTSPRAHFQEFGTAPHAIGVETKKLLVEGGSGQILGKTVQHPGNPPRPFIRPAYDETVDRVLKLVAERVTTKLEEIAAG